MKRILLTSIIAFVVAHASYAQISLVKGKEVKTPSGLSIKLITRGEGTAKPAEGDMLLLKLKVSTESADSLLFNSDDVFEREGLPYFEPLAKPVFVGDYSEALAMMQTGDSVIVKIVADSFFKYVFKMDVLPDFVKPGTNVVLNIKLLQFMPIEEFKKYINAEIDKRDKLYTEKEGTDIANFLAKNKIKATPTLSGLYYIENVKGKGDLIAAGQTATVKYTGMFLDSTVFDSSDGTDPIEVFVGGGMVIPGWDEALQLMQNGTKATVVGPFSLESGRRGSDPVIPPYATLLFTMEVVNVETTKPTPVGPGN